MSALDIITQVHQIQCDDVPKKSQMGLEIRCCPSGELIDRVGETEVDT